MGKLTYENSRAGIKGTVIVRLDGKRVGIILPRQGLYFYRPLGYGRKGEGDGFTSMNACKQSLEAPQ